MPRPARLLLSHSHYHVMTRGNNKNTIFRQDADYRYYLDLIARFKKELPFDLFHYCLMPSHVHQLIRTQNAEDFSLYMKKINLAYFHYYSRKYSWIGHFWQDCFKSQPVGKDEYFIQCGKYIELNPIRKKIVKEPSQYPYSSYKFYTTNEKSPLITEDIFFKDLGDSQKECQEAYQKLVIDDLVTGSYLKRAWGSTNQRYNEVRKIQHNLS